MAYTRAISSLGWPEGTLDDMVTLARRHNLDAIELRALENTVDLPQLFIQRYGTPAALAARMRDVPIRVLAFDTSVRLLDRATIDREKLLAFVPWAEALGVRWLRIFDGGKTADDAELAHAAGTMRWWQALRREQRWQVDLMVETHDALTTTPALQRFLAAAPGARLLWDTHHTWQKGGEDPISTWKILHSNVVHIHVKDSVSVPSPRHPFTYVLPGAGEFPAAPLFQTLRGEFDGAVCLEWEKLWHSYLPELDDALQAASAHQWW